jgi:cation diffusion facilitator family transporter
MTTQKLNLNNIMPVKPATSSPCHDVNHVLWRVLIVNLAVASAKIGAGMLAGSISMVADGFHSTMDASSNVIALIGSTIAGQPPDRNHPYGHQKYETFATLGIGLLLLVTSWNILKSVFARLTQATSPEITGFSFGVMLVTIGLNLLVVFYEKQRGRQLNSNLLLADAAHTKSDIFVSLSVMASLIAARSGWLWVDPVVALVIVGVIGYTGWQIVRRSSDILTDRAVVDAALVEKIALSVAGIESCHKIRSRGADQASHLDLHIQVDGKMPLQQAHQLGHIAQARLQRELGIMDVIVHVEPVQAASDSRPVHLPRQLTRKQLSHSRQSSEPRSGHAG